MNVVARSLQHCPALFGLLLCAFAGAASAGTLRVGPVRVMLDGDSPIATLTVHNSGDTPAVIQLEPMHWRQEDGTDIYKATTDLIATPPIFSLAPGESQTVRSGLRGKPPSDAEQAYRLYVREVVPESSPAPDNVNAGAIQVALRIGVPIFARPKIPLKPAELQWNLHCRDGSCEVGARNSGAMFIRVQHIKIADAAGHALLESSTPGYVLASSSMKWRAPAHGLPAMGTVLHLEAQTEEGRLISSVTLTE